MPDVFWASRRQDRRQPLATTDKSRELPGPSARAEDTSAVPPAPPRFADDPLPSATSSASGSARRSAASAPPPCQAIAALHSPTASQPTASPVSRDPTAENGVIPVPRAAAG